jgi:predicted CoA-substrate-specific enzyme activase
MTPLYLGIDVGSTTIKVVVVDRAQQIYFQRYLRSSGQPRQTLLRVADELYAQFDPAQIVGVGFSGSGGETIARMVGGHHVNELIAQTRAVGVFHPAARTVIEIGGQDSKFLSLSWDEATGRMVLKDFAMNSLCAAGTGSFLDQQAERLGIAIEDEFARLALQADNPARIAGRCTVFAKSDMIHLQQKGTPLSDILFGLCMALARNFKSVVAKGKPFVAPILIQGGIAYNDAVVRAFERVLALEPGQLIVPEHHPYMAALGTAFIAIDNEATDTLVPFRGFAGLSNQAQARLQETRSMPPLPATPPRLATEVHQPRAFQAQPAPVYLGIDVGSISTNIVLVNEQAQVVARRYLHTAGKPLEAVRNALLEIRDEVGDRVVVQGVGTTGSGRYLTGDFVGGDVVRNEITAQARAAIAINPEVDTIFEIGGQDSKYISIHNGTIVDFAMNSACAAGTGSFLEEQAERLKISLRQDFSPMACTAECPSALGERCTVFMESDIIHHQQQGAQVDELSAGLAYAIAQNYLNRVVHRRQVGQTIFFQGGVANNQSVVAAFQQLTHKPITVPPHNDVTGAIGAALLAMDALTIQRSTGKQVPSNFKGFDLRDRTYQTTVFTCKACPNLCDINRVTISGEPPLFYGARCDKFEEAGRSNTAHSTALPDLFAERNELLVGSYAAPETPRNGRRRVAMPRALTYYDLFPYWRTSRRPPTRRSSARRSNTPPQSRASRSSWCMAMCKACST